MRHRRVRSAGEGSAAPSQRQRVRCHVRRRAGTGPSIGSAELETAIYRIVQEALTNAFKHGEAKRAVVRSARILQLST